LSKIKANGRETMQLVTWVVSEIRTEPCTLSEEIIEK